MKGWAELKDAFWASVDAGAEERAHHAEALEAVDPALPARLKALLAADDRGESFEHLFQSEPAGTRAPARIGTYDIVGSLGVGGMGEVYRARDARLQREVAIKVLPAAVTNDPDRLARFEREAQVLASLNHPNIAQVYGLDLAVGQQVRVMVMSILAGVGTAGVPGGSLPMVMIVAQSVGIPAEGMALILGVDRFLDMCRTAVNVSGDLVIAAVVGRGEPHDVEDSGVSNAECA